MLTLTEEKGQMKKVQISVTQCMLTRAAGTWGHGGGSREWNQGRLVGGVNL